MLSRRALIAAAGATMVPRRPTGAPRPLPDYGIYGLRAAARAVSLTFDDGPDPRYTPEVLAILAARGVRATFFVIGENAARHPDLVAAMVAGGHRVANHSYTHARFTSLTRPAMEAELERAQRLLAGLGAGHERLFRPPRGAHGPAIRAVSDGLGYTTVFWDLTVERFLVGRSRGEGLTGMMARVRPGTILLAHDARGPLVTPAAHHDRSATLAGLPALLDRLDDSGYRVVDLVELARSAGAFERVRQGP